MMDCNTTPTTTTTSTSTSNVILTLDLGKFKSVACRYDPATGEHAFETIATTPSAVHDLLIETSPQLLVIEACGVCGWIADLAESLSIEVRVANTMGEAWKWKRVKRKTDRDDALKLAKLTATDQLPLVHVRHVGTLQARRVDVEIAVVVATAERPGIQPLGRPEGRNLLGGGGHPGRREERAEGVGEVRHAEAGRDDRPRQLGRVTHDEIGPPRLGDGQRVLQHPGRPHSAEQPREHEVRPLLRRQLPHLRKPVVELTLARRLVKTGGQRRDARPYETDAPISPRDPQHVVAATEERSCQRHHRVQMTHGRNRGEEDAHAAMFARPGRRRVGSRLAQNGCTRQRVGPIGLAKDTCRLAARDTCGLWISVMILG